VAKLQKTHRITLMSLGIMADGKTYPRYIVVDSPEEVARFLNAVADVKKSVRSPQISER
jgi:hypothetical protein